jgi:hypothetical protein
MPASASDALSASVVITPIPVGATLPPGQQGTGGFKILEGVSTRDDLGPPADHQPSLLQRLALPGDSAEAVQPNTLQRHRPCLSPEWAILCNTLDQTGAR